MPHFPQHAHPGPSLDLLDAWSDQGFVPGALWLAAAGEQPVGVVQALRAAGAGTLPATVLNQADPNQGWTPLMMLLMVPPRDHGRNGLRVLPNHPDDWQRAAMALLDAGADPFQTDVRGLSAVAHAAIQNAGLWLDHLVNRFGADLLPLQAVRVPKAHLREPRAWMEPDDPNLLAYLLLKQGPGVASLLNAGWPIDLPLASGTPWLHLARCTRDMELLLNAGADPLGTSPNGDSAAKVFTREVEDTEERNRMLHRLHEVQQQRLLDDPAQQQRWRQQEFNALFDAIGSATKDTFVKLYKNVVNGRDPALTVDTPHADGRRLLEEAWVQDKTVIVSFLLDQGADPCLPGSHGVPLWVGQLAAGPVTRQAGAKESRDEIRRKQLRQRLLDDYPLDPNARLADGRSLLLATVMEFSRIAPSFAEVLERERTGKRPKALWWAVHQLLNMGARPRTYDTIRACPIMAGEETQPGQDLRWLAALAGAMVPPLGTYGGPDPAHMGVTNVNEVDHLFARVLSPAERSRVPGPVASAWFATLVGAYAQQPQQAALSGHPGLLEKLKPFAEMPQHHPLAQHGPWQARVQTHGGAFALVLEKQALLRVANETMSTALPPSAGRRRL